MTDYEPHEADEVAVPAQEVDAIAKLVVELRGLMRQQAAHNAPITPEMFVKINRLYHLVTER